jgi:hypothetical protein
VAVELVALGEVQALDHRGPVALTTAPTIELVAPRQSRTGGAPHALAHAGSG